MKGNLGNLLWGKKDFYHQETFFFTRLKENCRLFSSEVELEPNCLKFKTILLFENRMPLI